MLSKFFLDRPVFAWVIAIILMVSGVMAIFTLPIAQYPNVAPPTIFVNAHYQGADAQTLSETVAIPLEEQINGVEDMLYMESVCTNDGACRLIVTFKVGTDLNMAQVLVQKKTNTQWQEQLQIMELLGLYH